MVLFLEIFHCSISEISDKIQGAFSFKNDVVENVHFIDKAAHFFSSNFIKIP